MLNGHRGATLPDNSITVGIPVRNAMPFLPEAMESLFRQTAGGFQILVIVDGADEASLRYLDSIHDPRLRVLVQPHSGLTATLNRMLHEVKTAWLVRQDADDVSYPTRIERLQEEISRHQDSGMFYSLAEYYPRRSLGLYRCSRGTPEQLRRIVQSGYLLSICHPSVALNVEKTLAVGGYRDLPHAEDADLWWRMALQYDIRLLPEVLIGFRHHADSVSSQNGYTQELHGLYIQYLLLSELEGRMPLPLPEIAHLLKAAIPEKKFKAKQHLRRLNMHMVAKHYGSALMAVARTAAASPAYLVQRIWDELASARVIANGVSPKMFYEKKEAFWP